MASWGALYGVFSQGRNPGLSAEDLIPVQNGYAIPWTGTPGLVATYSERVVEADAWIYGCYIIKFMVFPLLFTMYCHPRSNEKESDRTLPM